MEICILETDADALAAKQAVDSSHGCPVAIGSYKMTEWSPVYHLPDGRPYIIKPADEHMSALSGITYTLDDDGNYQSDEI